MNIDPLLIVDQLKAHELLVEELYRMYAGFHPDHAKFWDMLANEEASHVGWTSNLRAAVETGSIRVNPVEEIDSTGIAKSSYYVQHLISDATVHGCDVDRCYRNAIEIEKAPFELKFTDLFLASDDPGQSLLNELMLQYKGHLNVVQEYRDAKP